MLLKKIYHILVLLQTKEKEIIVFDNFLPKNYFAGNVKQDLKFEIFMKNRSYIEERNIKMEDRYNAIIKNGLPKIYKDP